MVCMVLKRAFGEGSESERKESDDQVKRKLGSVRVLMGKET